MCTVSSAKKYGELHPKKEEKKEKKGKEKAAKEEKPKQEKPKQEKAKKQAAEEEDDLPKEPKFKDPYAGLPKRYCHRFMQEISHIVSQMKLNHNRGFVSV